MRVSLKHARLRQAFIILLYFILLLLMLQRLHHPHTVQFLGAVTLARPYMIVTEFIAGGSLADLFSRCERPGPKCPGIKRALEIAQDIIRGMSYLHRFAPPVHASVSISGPR